MDKTDLEKLKELARAATPGPWEIASNCNQAVWTRECVINAVTDSNASFIAAVSPDVLLALIDRLERSEAHEDHMRQWAELDMEHAHKLTDWMASLAKLLDMEEDAYSQKTAMQDIYKAVERLKEDFDAAARDAADESVKAVQLEEEAQFLAIRCERLCNAITCCDDCPYNDENCPEQTIETIDGAGWRKKAKMFVEAAHAYED